MIREALCGALAVLLFVFAASVPDDAGRMAYDHIEGDQ